MTLPSSSTIGRFDQAIFRRSPSFVSQWPICGLDTVTSANWSRNPSNALCSSGGITTSRASRPITSPAVNPVARSQASSKLRMRPDRSSLQTRPRPVRASTSTYSSGVSGEAACSGAWEDMRKR